MIEIISIEPYEEPKKLDITPEMQLSAARIMKSGCENYDYCTDCPLEKLDICGEQPYRWNLPKSNEVT